MNKIALLLLAAFVISACGSLTGKTDHHGMTYPNIPVVYPQTAREEAKSSHFGIEVADPYRWLEDDNAPATAAWVAEQNRTTFGYLERIPFRESLRERYRELFNYPKYSAPFQAGDYYFFSKNDGLQNQAVIYRQKGLDGEPEVFIDPNELSADGTTSLEIAGISRDNRYLAVSRQDAGSDWQRLAVYDVQTMKQLDDALEWVKFSGASWWKEGFFYSRYPPPVEGAEYTGNNLHHSVYYHRLGEPQGSDRLVFEDRDNPGYYHIGLVTEDERYLVLYQAPGTDGYAVHYKDLEQDGDFITLFDGFEHKSAVVHNIGARFLVRTNIDAPNYRLVEIDITRPARENWKELIPESEHLLQECATGGGRLFVNYLQNASNHLYTMAYDGSGRTELRLPGVGSADVPGGLEEHTTLFYTFTSFLYPPVIFRYEVATGESSVFQKIDLQFDPDAYVERQVTYQSRDGTPVTMFLVHRKDLARDGSHPAYLYGYGGFGESMSPYFSTSRILLLENGGVFAMPNLRGGGEYGEQWHRDGMRMNKQNVFDDFIAAAEYLVDEGYTAREKLAIAGGSNGGLLVGVFMTQRPELASVAFPAVGVMDMLRYHLFTVGKGWIPEYGASDESREMFEYIKSYSPLHNLRPGTAYPATLITTADHDDRVVPAHSFKFAAQLQADHGGDHPVLIRVETDAGHGAGTPTAKIIDEIADIYSFLFYNTNTPVRYRHDHRQ